MNLKFVIKILSIVFIITGLAMIPAFITSIIYKEQNIAIAFAITAPVLTIINYIVYRRIKPSSSVLRARESILIVGACWILCSLIGAIPYMISGYTTSFIDAFFESTAGFTTTGATVMNVEIMPRGILMWKAMTHWLGGMGIIVLAVSLMPALGIGGFNLFAAESPGIRINKMTSRISDSAKMLYIMYLVFFVVEFILLLFSEMTPFEAIINALGSVTTSGIVSHTAGLAYFDSVYIEVVIAIFTILASINFLIYHFALTGKFKDIIRDIELKVFISMIIGACTFVVLNLYFSGIYDSIGECLRYAFFQVTSMTSTAGFSITDYTTWPTASKLVLFLLMTIGGCGASTCGGIKLARIVLAVKLIGLTIYRKIHPRAVVTLKACGETIPPLIVSQAISFIFVYLLVFLLGSWILSIQGLDLQTTFSSAMAMISNTGIAFGEVGGSGNFAVFTPPLRLVLSFLMIIGRLEIFTLLFLFMPSFWNPNKHKMK